MPIKELGMLVNQYTKCGAKKRPRIVQKWREMKREMSSVLSFHEKHDDFAFKIRAKFFCVRHPRISNAPGLILANTRAWMRYCARRWLRRWPCTRGRRDSVRAAESQTISGPQQVTDPWWKSYSGATLELPCGSRVVDFTLDNQGFSLRLLCKSSHKATMVWCTLKSTTR